MSNSILKLLSCIRESPVWGDAWIFPNSVASSSDEQKVKKWQQAESDLSAEQKVQYH